MMRLISNDDDQSSKLMPFLSPLLSTNLLPSSSSSTSLSPSLDKSINKQEQYNSSDILFASIISPSNCTNENKTSETSLSAAVKSCPFFDAHYWR